MSAQIHKFDTPNRAGGRQFVAHRLYVAGGSSKYSIWFSDADGGTLVDAERFDRAGRSFGVSNKTLAWKLLARKIPSLIAAWERDNLTPAQKWEAKRPAMIAAGIFEREVI